MNVRPYSRLRSNVNDKMIAAYRAAEAQGLGAIQIEGEMIDMANPNRFSAGLREDYAAAPLLGGHSVEILSELGYAESEIDDMVRSNTVVDGRRL